MSKKSDITSFSRFISRRCVKKHSWLFSAGDIFSATSARWQHPADLLSELWLALGLINFSLWAVFFDSGCLFQTLCHFRLHLIELPDMNVVGQSGSRDECFDIDFTFTGDVNHLWSVTSVTSDFVSKSSFRRTISDPEWIAFVTNSSSSVMRRRC